MRISRMDSESDEIDTGVRRPDDESNWDSDNSDDTEEEKTERRNNRMSDEYFSTEIFHAVTQGRPDRIRDIAHRYDLNADREIPFLLSALIHAQHEGCNVYSDSRVAEVLLELGARPTGKVFGWAVQAVCRGDLHKKFIGILLRAGANVNEPFKDLNTKLETTPFRVSLGYRDPYMMNRLMRCGGRISSHADIREMVLHDNLPLLDKAVKDGWDPLARHNGLTHLEALCYNASHHVEILPAVRWLMDHGATLTQRTPEGGPLLSYLLYQYDMRYIRKADLVWFLDHGAAKTIDWKDKYGDSPLSIAVASNAEDMILFLLERGVKPDSGNALKKATGEMAYHPESTKLIRPMRPITRRTVSILRGERVDGRAPIYQKDRMNYR
jgi:ankyrin repeat protein